MPDDGGRGTAREVRRPLDGEILAKDDPRGTDGAFRADERHVRNRFFQTVRRAAAQIPFMTDVVAAYYCALDPATPMRVRAVILGALVYFVTPFDALPDIIAGIGFTDDVTVLFGTITMVAAHITDTHRHKARAALDATGR